MDKTEYIVASAKEWHRVGFEALQTDIDARWTWVATPEELGAAVAAGSPRYIFFLHWNWHVPREIWSCHESVCFHMTDLPYGRGGSPLQNLIVAGHKETCLTALRMAEEMDAGPIYTKRPLVLQGRAEDIYLRAGTLSFEIIRWMIRSTPEPVPQVGEPVNFKRRRPFQSVLPLQGEIETLYDHIRMLDAETYPLAFIEYGEFRLEFSHAELEGDVLRAQVSLRKVGSSGGEN